LLLRRIRVGYLDSDCVQSRHALTRGASHAEYPWGGQSWPQPALRPAGPAGKRVRGLKARPTYQLGAPQIWTFSLVIGAAFGLEGGGPVLAEFFLPTVEHRRLQSQLVTELGDWLLLQQMPPQNGGLLFSGVILSWFLHAFSPLS
jgi:hypothetical protein